MGSNLHDLLCENRQLKADLRIARDNAVKSEEEAHKLRKQIQRLRHERGEHDTEVIEK